MVCLFSDKSQINVCVDSEVVDIMVARIAYVIPPSATVFQVSSQHYDNDSQVHPAHGSELPGESAKYMGCRPSTESEAWLSLKETRVNVLRLGVARVMVSALSKHFSVV